MFVSQNNNRLFLAIVVGMFLASGCSGHSVKYGANSEGEGMASEEEMTGSVDSAPYVTTSNADGTTEHGGTVDSHAPILPTSQGALQDSQNSGEMNSEMAVADDASSIPGNVSDYGHQFNGVDGAGPNHDSVTGFGSGSADATHPDPEAWANAYLQGKRSSPDFYGDSSTADSTTQSTDEPNPEMWAQEFVKENGGPSPEHVNSDMSIAQADEQKDPRPLGASESNGELIPIRNTSGHFKSSVQDIYFAFDSWSIDAEGAKYLEEDAQWLHANPEKGLTIEGHCDQRGTQDYNLVLGKKRAEAAREYLVNLGIQPNRLKIVSYGKERPFCQNNHEGCYQENRRNHMVVRMNQS